MSLWLPTSRRLLSLGATAVVVVRTSRPQMRSNSDRGPQICSLSQTRDVQVASVGEKGREIHNRKCCCHEQQFGTVLLHAINLTEKMRNKVSWDKLLSTFLLIYGNMHI